MELINILSEKEILDPNELSDLIKSHFNVEDIEATRTKIAIRIFKRAYKRTMGTQRLSILIRNLKRWDPKFHDLLEKSIKRFILNTVTRSNWTGKKREIGSLAELEEFIEEIKNTFQVKVPPLKEILEEMLKEEIYKKAINKPKARKRYLKILKEAVEEDLIPQEQFKKVFFEFLKAQEKTSKKTKKGQKSKKKPREKRKVKPSKLKKQKKPSKKKNTKKPNKKEEPPK